LRQAEQKLGQTKTNTESAKKENYLLLLLSLQMLLFKMTHPSNTNKDRGKTHNAMTDKHKTF